MNRLQIWFARALVLLLGTTGLAQAETVYWSDNFDTNAAARWSASASGVWKLGAPTAGPAVGSSGYRTHSGADCASSQGYGLSQDVRLVCSSYNGAAFLTVPSADQAPRLRFWHWFNFDNALGYVEISTNGGASWGQLSPTYLNLNGGGVWTRPYLDLSAYAGQNILIAFHFTSGCCVGNGLGWFVDDVAVVTGTTALNLPEDFAGGLGDWSVDYGTWEVGPPASGPGTAHMGTNCAATVLAGNYANNVDSRLISPPIQVPSSGSPALSFYHWYNFNNAVGYVEINNGSLTSTSVTNTTITTNLFTSLNTNVYFFNGSGDPAYAAPFYWNSSAGEWTNGLGKALAYVYTGGTVGGFFESGYNYPTYPVGGANVDYRAAVFPNPPTAPTNFLDWQGVVWNPVANEGDIPVGFFGTNTTTITYTTNSTVTTSQSTWTNLSPVFRNGASGGWTNVSLDLSAYAGQLVHLAFHFTSGGFSTAPGWYIDNVNLVGSPVLTVPAAQTIYAGQTLVVTNDATNSVLPNASYTFAVLPPALAPSITSNGPGTAVFTWTNYGVVNGVLTWTNSAAAPGTYTIAVTATDNSLPPLVVTNYFQLVVLPPPGPSLTTSPVPTAFAGQTLTLTNYASNVNLPGATYVFSLLSPANAGINLTPNGVLTWTPPAGQPSGLATITVKVTDNSIPPLAATNSFVVPVTNLWAPTLKVPANQTLYAGQSLAVTNTATNSLWSSDTFTYEILAGLTNSAAHVDTSDLAAEGVLRWATAMNLESGTYTNVIKAVDNFTQYAVTNSFLVTVMKTPPPLLTVPATQAIYAGQPLNVTNGATDLVYPFGPFSFGLLAGLTDAAAGLDASGLATNGVLRWGTTTALAAGTYTNVVVVTNRTTGLAATNRFLVVVSTPPTPTLRVPATPQVIHAGQRLQVALAATNSAFPKAVYTFSAPAAPAGVTVTSVDAANATLTWTPTARQATNVYLLSIQVLDHNQPPLGATNSCQVIVGPMPAPPALSGAGGANPGEFQLSFSSLSNTLWYIQAATNPAAASSNWLPVFTNLVGTDGRFLFIDRTSTNFPQRYYRAVLP